MTKNTKSKTKTPKSKVTVVATSDGKTISVKDNADGNLSVTFDNLKFSRTAENSYGVSYSKYTASKHTVPTADAPAASPSAPAVAPAPGTPSAPATSFSTFTFPQVRRVFPTMSTVEPRKYPVEEKPLFVLEKGLMYVKEVYSPMDTLFAFSYTYGNPTTSTGLTMSTTTLPYTAPSEPVKDYSKFDKYLVLSDPLPPEETSLTQEKDESVKPYSFIVAFHYAWTQKVYNLRTHQEERISLNDDHWMSGLSQRWHLISETGEVSDEYLSNERAIEADPSISETLKQAASKNLLAPRPGTLTSNTLSIKRTVPLPSSTSEFKLGDFSATNLSVYPDLAPPVSNRKKQQNKPVTKKPTTTKKTTPAKKKAKTSRVGSSKNKK